MSELKKMQEQLDKYQLELEHLQAVNAIQACMAHYEQVHLNPE